MGVQVLGILDEKRYHVIIQVFPNKLFIYNNDITFLTPFICLEDADYSNSPKFKRQLIEKNFVKIKKKTNIFGTSLKTLFFFKIKRHRRLTKIETKQ